MCVAVIMFTDLKRVEKHVRFPIPFTRLRLGFAVRGYAVRKVKAFFTSLLQVSFQACQGRLFGKQTVYFFH